MTAALVRVLVCAALWPSPTPIQTVAKCLCWLVRNEAARIAGYQDKGLEAPPKNARHELQQ